MPRPGSPLAPIPSRECLAHIERHLIPQHVVRRAGQLVRYRLDRHDPVGPRLLALIPAVDRDRVPDGEVGRLDKGPGQVGVAVLDVPPCPLRLQFVSFVLPTQRQYEAN